MEEAGKAMRGSFCYASEHLLGERILAFGTAIARRQKPQSQNRKTRRR